MTTPIQPPSEFTYGTLRWRVFSFVADTTSDANDLPEFLAVNGKAYLTPDVAGDGLLATSLPVPVTILKQRMELLITNGVLQDKAGNTDVRVLGNDSPGLSQTGWSYTIEYELDDGATFGSFSFYLASGQIVDLTSVVPLATPEAGTVIIKGDKGDGFTYRGEWAEAVVYGENDVVTRDGTTFVVIEGHESTLITAPTLETPGAWYAVWSAKGGPGAAGPGVPAGGTAEQVLSKIDSTDFNTAWTTATSDNVSSSIVRRAEGGTFAATSVVLTGQFTASDATRKDYVDSGDTAAKSRANHTGTQLSSTLSDLTETVHDIVAGLIVAGSNVVVSYDDVAGTFTISSTGGTGGTTDPEIVRDVIGSAMVAGSGIQITVNDAGDTITIASTAVLPTRQIISGTGLSGGGDLSTNRTLSVVYGTTAGTSAQGNDARLSDARTPTAHTHGVTDLTATGTRDATTVLHGDNTWKVPAGGGGGVTDHGALTGLADDDHAQYALADGSRGAFAPTSHQHTASQISDSSVVGRSVITAADASAARTAIGAGTSSLALGTTSTTAKAGDYAPPAASATVSGLVELATTTEATTGTDTVRAVTPAGLKAMTDTKVTNGGGVSTATKLTQAAYDAIVTKDANTLYVIVG